MYFSIETTNALLLAMYARFCFHLCAVSTTVSGSLFLPYMLDPALVCVQFLPQFLILSFWLYGLYPALAYTKFHHWFPRLAFVLF